MEHKNKGSQKPPADRRLVLLGCAVLLGALGGSLVFPRWSVLRGWLSAGGQARATFGALFLPEAALLCAMQLWSLVSWGCLPALLTAGAKGFLLSARAAAAMAERGFWQVFCLQLLPGFLELTALLLLGRQTIGLALARQGRKGLSRRPDSAWLLSFGLCLLLALAGTLVRWRLLPALTLPAA